MRAASKSGSAQTERAFGASPARREAHAASGNAPIRPIPSTATSTCKPSVNNARFMDGGLSLRDPDDLSAVFVPFETIQKECRHGAVRNRTSPRGQPVDDETRRRFGAVHQTRGSGDRPEIG